MMESMKNREASEPKYKVREEKTVYVEMRDGVRLCCDIFRPDAEGKFPALLGISPYSKERQSLKIPPMPFSPEFASIEIGNSEYFVSRGYVHVVADVRGTGHSEGKFSDC